jgi:signal transduction histidine kinase
MISNRQIKKLIKQLREIPENARYNRRIYVDDANSSAAKLSAGINALVDSYEGKMRESKKMESNVRLAISGLAHDIRTPLTSLIGYIQMLRSAPEERRNEYLDAIGQAADALRELNENFYALSKLEQDKNDLLLVPVDLYREVCDIVVAYYAEFEGRNIAVEIHESESNMTTFADRVALGRIVTNLTQNALRYAVSKMIISFAGGDGYCRVKFENDSEYVPQDLNALFERFATGDSSRSSRGVGLGLYVCRDLVTAIGGGIDAKHTSDGIAILVSFKSVDA